VTSAFFVGSIFTPWALPAGHHSAGDHVDRMVLAEEEGGATARRAGAVMREGAHDH
jgi:hypothetical protein